MSFLSWILSFPWILLEYECINLFKHNCIQSDKIFDSGNNVEAEQYAVKVFVVIMHSKCVSTAVFVDVYLILF